MVAEESNASANSAISAYSVLFVGRSARNVSYYTMESGIVKRNFKKSCTFRQKAEKQRKYVLKWAGKAKNQTGNLSASGLIPSRVPCGTRTHGLQIHNLAR